MLLLSACGANDTTSSAADGTALGFVNVAEAGDATPGGTLTFGSFSFPSSLDPTVTLAAGSNGGTEMAAVYDTLIRKSESPVVV